MMKNKLFINPMRYQSERKVEILCEAIYLDYHFYILSLGTHPTAYIEIPNENILFGKDYQEIYDMQIDINVHGGLTYSDDHLQNIKKNSWFIGWDYAHFGDYTGYEKLISKKYRTGGKQWTIVEILNDVITAIEQIKVINND